MSEQKQDIVSIIMREVRWPRPAAQRLADALLDSLVDTMRDWKADVVLDLAEEFEDISRQPRKWMAYPSAARIARDRAVVVRNGGRR